MYDARHSQLEIFEATALPIVRAAMEGYNGTIFAYGQTGTGKTHTMEGKPESASERGIIPNAFNDVFDQIDASSSATDVDATYLVRASYLEIYNEDIRDLLAKDQNRRHELKEHPESGVYVKDLTTFVVKSASEIQNVLNVGKKNRSVGATLMNADSSRVALDIHHHDRVLEETRAGGRGGARAIDRREPRRTEKTTTRTSPSGS